MFHVVSGRHYTGFIADPAIISRSTITPVNRLQQAKLAQTESSGRSTRRRVSSVSHYHRQHALEAASARHPSDESPATRERQLDSASVVHSSSDTYTQPMSLSRSPSPQRAGGWASPGLSNSFASGSRSSTPVKSYSVNGPHNVTWASAQARSAQVNGYPAYQQNGMGFFGKHMRNISASLPFFNTAPQDDRFAEKEKLGRGRWQPPPGSSTWSNVRGRLGRLIWRMRLRFVLVVALLFTILCFYATRESCPSISIPNSTISDKLVALHYWYRRTSWLGGGSKFVVILAANQGGGVMEWKGAREWAIERDSVRNKKNYVQTWGYDLEIVDMSTKKRYAHEWRESWEKVDTIRNAMRKYPQAEWYVLCSFLEPRTYPPTNS